MTVGRYGLFNLKNGGRIYIPIVADAVFDPQNLSRSWEDIDIHDVDASTAQKFPIGTQLRLGDAVHMYVEAGGTIAVGLGVQAEAPDDVHDALAPVAASAGATTFSITSPASGSADFIVNEYAQGRVRAEVNGTPGYDYPIYTHATLDISETATMEVVLQRPYNLAVALTTSDDMEFIKHPGKECIVAPTTLTAMPFGVAKAALADGEFGWVGIKGPHAARSDGTLILGQVARWSETVAGEFAAQNYDEADDADIGDAGRVAALSADNAYGQINFSDTAGLAVV